MVYIDDNNVVLPELAKPRKLKGQIHIEYETASVASSYASNKPAQQLMDETDVGCIITRIHRHTDEMAHIINAQRENKDAKREVVSSLSFVPFIVLRVV